MESLAILGLAGNILQFLDFSGKIISGTLELYQSANGATSSNLVLENTSKDLVQLCAAMLPDLTSRSALTRSDSETALITLSESCRTLGQELLTVLEDLKVKGRRKRWQSARQALRSAWKARDVQRLESQLASYRSQIAARLLAILIQTQDQTSSQIFGLAENVSGVAAALDRLEGDHRRSGICTVNEVAQLRYQIVDVLKSTSAHAGTNVAINRTEDNAVKLPAEISTWLSTVQSAGALLSKQIRILNSLKFPSLSEREENVKEAHPATFEWLFEPAANALTSTKPPRIFDWLIEGSGVFWVSGRAGSGKSTLMKFFYRNPKTVTALQQWAGTRKLVVANFFFWHAGTTMQKSQQGLLQTLLYHILQQDPSLIAAMCPSRWNQSASSMESWSYAEVLEVVERIKEQTLDSFRFCFFLDGLDEFEGDHMDIVSTINSLASSDAIKVCFSSRPWTVFENAYGPKTESVIRVHDLTQGDITRFVEDRLAEGTQFLKLKATAAAYGELVDEIRERSNGVFLWVYLVVRSLRRGMTNLDTVSELQKRLRELPVELEAYFQLMLDSTERVYHQQAARLYRVRLVAHIPPTVNDVWMFAEDDLDFALRDKYLDMPQPSFLATTKTRILARCQDLLEFDKHSQLQFLHRTVKDFLETRDMLSLLIKRAGAHFNPHHFMCNSMLLPMKQAAQSSELALPGYSNLSDFRDLSSALEVFWYHARVMEVEQEQDYRLFSTLDRTMKKRIQMANYPGWLADNAAKSGIVDFLPHFISSGIDVLDEGGSPIRKSPLEVALRFMLSDYHRLRITKRLLEAGADPNERVGHDDFIPQHQGTNITIWQAYIADLEQLSSSSDGDIIESLLTSGADPNIGGCNQGFFKDCLVSTGMSETRINKLEALRLDLRSRQPEQQQLAVDEKTILGFSSLDGMAVKDGYKGASHRKRGLVVRQSSRPILSKGH